MTARVPTSTDDRDHACGIVSLSGREIGARALGIRAMLDPLARRELAVTGKLELAWAIGAGVIAGVIWQLVWLQGPVLGMLGLCGGFIVLPTAAAGIAWWLSLGSVRRRSFRHLADIHLSCGRCASCGYELAGLATEGDGCVACPECGAAWRAERIGAGERGSGSRSTP